MRKVLVLLFLLLVLFVGCSTTTNISAESEPKNTPYPTAKSGTVVEMVSPSEVLIDAFGIYNGVGKGVSAQRKDVDENGVEKAIIDARKSAVYMLLFSGTDPLLNNESKKMKFEPFASKIFSNENLDRYISFEESKLNSKLKLNDGTTLKISKTFKINKSFLTSDLVNFGVMESQESIITDLGNPIIMVIPDLGSTGKSLKNTLQDQIVRHSTGVLQSYLTARNFDVIVADQVANISDMISTEQAVAGNNDVSYQIALSIGSDVYLTFSGKDENTSLGTTRYVVTLSAYETTTGRLLGSETGYSNSRKGDILVSVEEALNDAVDKTISRALAYWEKDLKSGVQYKIIVTLPAYLDSTDIDTLQMAFLETVSKIALKEKEVIMTNETIDYLVWVDPEKYSSSLKLYMDIKKEFERLSEGANMGKTSSNRKLLQLSVEY